MMSNEMQQNKKIQIKSNKTMKTVLHLCTKLISKTILRGRNSNKTFKIINKNNFYYKFVFKLVINYVSKYQ